MSARSRALEYAKQVRDNSKRRMPNNFEHKSNVPAFQTSDRSRNDDISAEAKPIRDQESQLDGDQHQDVVDSKSFTPGIETGKALVPTTTSTHRKPEATLGPAFSKMWTTVQHYQIAPKTYDEKSMYIPSSLAMFQILHEMENVLHGNEEIRWIAPNYFSLPVRVYYSVLFYVQVYRAKQQAGIISKSESSWLRAFERRFKDTSCEIAGPLVPFFTNITSVLPDDGQFDFVYPSVKPGGVYSSTYDKTSKKYAVIVDSTNYINPSVLLIADVFKRFCLKHSIEEEDLDERGNYIPFQFSTGGTLGGVVFPPNVSAADYDHDLVHLLFNPALMHPLPEGLDRLREVHPFYRRSKGRNIPIPAPENGVNCTSPSDFTLLGENLDWFQQCVDMALAQSRFFTDSRNLSSIPANGSQSTLVQCHLSFDKYKELPTKISEWYPQHCDSAKSLFRSTTAKLDIAQQFQAMSCLTVTSIDWKSSAGHIGSLKSGERTGPYWENSKYNFELAHSVAVLKNLSTTIASQFYDAYAHKS
nr:MAG: coat protein [Xiaogan partiti-like virus 1]